MSTPHFIYRTLSVRGFSLAYRIPERELPANKPAIILLHGLSTSNLYMLPTARLLATDYRIFVPDMIGFGRSEKPKQVLTLTEQADILVDWLHALGMEHAIWFANSLGCQVVAQIALRSPGCVERIIFAGPTMDPRALTARQEITRWLINIIFEPKILYLIIFYDFLRAGFRRVAVTLRYGLEDHIDKHLPHIHIPTLVVRGSRDTVVPQRWAEEATRLLPDGRLFIIQRAAHDVNYNSPRELATCIQEFLTSPASSAPSNPPTHPLVPHVETQ